MKKISELIKNVIFVKIGNLFRMKLYQKLE